MSFLKNIVNAAAPIASAIFPAAAPFIGAGDALLNAADPSQPQQSNPLQTVASAIGPAAAANAAARGDWRVAEQMRNDAANRIQGATGTSISDFFNQLKTLNNPNAQPATPSTVSMGSVPWSGAPQLQGVNAAQPWMPTPLAQQPSPYLAALQAMFSSGAPSTPGLTPPAAGAAPGPAAAPAAPGAPADPNMPGSTAVAEPGAGVKGFAAPGLYGTNPSYSLTPGTGYGYNGVSNNPALAVGADASGHPFSTEQAAQAYWTSLYNPDGSLKSQAGVSTLPVARAPVNGAGTPPSFAAALAGGDPQPRGGFGGAMRGAYAA